MRKRRRRKGGGKGAGGKGKADKEYSRGSEAAQRQTAEVDAFEKEVPSHALFAPCEPEGDEDILTCANV